MDSDQTIYDVLTNYEIEKAYEKDEKGKYTQGKQDSEVHFTIDFKKMKEKDHLLDTKYEVVRVDLSKQG